MEVDPKRPKSAADKGMPAEFSGFIVSLAQTAMIHMGEVKDPVTGETARNIAQARYSIDLIDMLAEKTRGNLTGEEELLLKQVQRDLKIRYVRAK